jgi:hypothetical protein
MSLHEKLMEAAEEKVREWEDFRQNCVIFTKQFADAMRGLVDLGEIRYHPSPEDAPENLPDLPLPKAIFFHNDGWAKVIVKFDAGHVTCKVPVETKVHAGQAEIRVVEMTEQFSWPLKDAQLTTLETFAKRVVEAVIDDLRNDLELYMQGKLSRSMKFS